jgi:hypothetical protein
MLRLFRAGILWLYLRLVWILRNRLSKQEKQQKGIFAIAIAAVSHFVPLFH